MNIEISLNNENPKGLPFLILGDPKQPTLHLTFNSKESKSIDFSKLNTDEQKQLLIAIRDNKVKSNIDFGELHKVYLQKVKPDTSEEKPKREDNNNVQNTTKKNSFSLEEVRKTHEKNKNELFKRAKYINSKNTKSLKKALDTKSELSLVKEVLKIEEAKKRPRKGIVLYLSELIRKINLDVQKRIGGQNDNTSSASTVEKLNYNGEVFEYEATSSEESTVEINLNDLKTFVQ